MGIEISASGWGKPLGRGLYEFRIRQSLHALRTFGQTNPEPAATGQRRTVLLRVFLTFHGDQVILLFHGLNKGRDPSVRRQQKEIKKARQLLADWQRRRKEADLAGLDYVF